MGSRFVGFAAGAGAVMVAAHTGMEKAAASRPACANAATSARGEEGPTVSGLRTDREIFM
jgi:hypothetical protein